MARNLSQDGPWNRRLRSFKSRIAHSESAALSFSALPTDFVASLSRAAPLPNQLESVTSASPAIPQARRDAVDGELDAGQHLLARRARTVQLQKLDLYVVEWVEIRETIADRAVEQRIAFEQLRLLHDCVQRIDRVAPLA